MPRYIFFDLDSDLLEVYGEILSGISNVEVYDNPVDLRDLEEIDVFVSPANSQGWMNGGIDAAYCQLFPGVQKEVQGKIAKLFVDSITNKPTLPVGSATIVSIENDNHDVFQLVCAPTMFYPANISKTPENILYAMYAILRVTQYLPADYNVGIPGLGTGVGCVSFQESARQIKEAFELHARNSLPNYPQGMSILHDTGDSYVIGNLIF